MLERPTNHRFLLRPGVIRKRSDSADYLARGTLSKSLGAVRVSGISRSLHVRVDKKRNANEQSSEAESLSKSAFRKDPFLCQ